MHHPYSGSWGYQVTGFYATVSTMGSPDDFRYFVDHMHANGIGVHPRLGARALRRRDAWALARFDGTALYEHDDPRRGAASRLGHATSSTSAAREVQNFLLANALFWLREYHADGLRVDAVASMLYLDYSRKEGEWVPNAFGGREDLDAVAFLKEFNELVHAREPGVISAAEESTAWPGVSRPTYVGGLGFGFKWNMGWMHDTLGYFQHDPIHRRYHHHELTFSLVYAWNENFILPLSHDEVVHGKGSLLAKMPGDRWQQLANLRALYAYMWAHPGKKLLFMGGELATPWEWADERRAAVVAARARRARGHARPRARPERDLPRRARALGGRLLARGLPLARAERRDEQRARVHAPLEGRRRARSSASRTSRPCRARATASGCRAAASGTSSLNTDSTYYGGTGVGNMGAVRGRGARVARPAVLGASDAAAARRSSGCAPAIVSRVGGAGDENARASRPCATPGDVTPDCHDSSSSDGRTNASLRTRRHARLSICDATVQQRDDRRRDRTSASPRRWRMSLAPCRAVRVSRIVMSTRLTGVRHASDSDVVTPADEPRMPLEHGRASGRSMSHVRTWRASSVRGSAACRAPGWPVR